MVAIVVGKNHRLQPPGVGTHGDANVGLFASRGIVNNGPQS